MLRADVQDQTPRLALIARSHDRVNMLHNLQQGLFRAPMIRCVENLHLPTAIYVRLAALRLSLKQKLCQNL
eukprot:337013-Karenia_brevis.AAC.1